MLEAMEKSEDAPVQKARRTLRVNWRPLLPGLGISLVAGGAAMLLNHWVATISALLIAIVAGAIVGHIVHLDGAPRPGIDFAGKHLLRAGIVLLGLQIVLQDVLALGWPMLVVVVVVVLCGIFGTLLMGKALRLTYPETALISSGFSICGAAAVAGADGVIDDTDDAEVIAAIALVVLFGTLMIPLVPGVAALLGMPERQAGLWAGASIHEVAQVVAAGGAVGAGALQVAVITKLTRVLLLAPVMIGFGVAQRYRQRHGLTRRSATGSIKNPPLIQGFVVGFIVAMAVASLHILPAPALQVATFLQTLLLSAAMFALGTGVTWKRLKHVGGRTVILAALSTIIVAGVALAGIWVTQPW